jgi:dsDNA-specific endonuclease/ATPase MutS2
MMSWKVEEASAEISSNIHILDRGDCLGAGFRYARSTRATQPPTLSQKDSFEKNALAMT